MPTKSSQTMASVKPTIKLAFPMGNQTSRLLTVGQGQQDQPEGTLVIRHMQVLRVLTEAILSGVPEQALEVETNSSIPQCSRILPIYL